MWARLGDGDHAWRIVRRSLAPATGMGIRYDAGGVYANLFDACPPFQIDANFAMPAAIAEKLLQAHAGKIELLPALPDAWKNGKISGLRARGGFQMDVAWQNGKLTSATIRSDKGEPRVVSYGGKTVELKIKRNKSVTLDGTLDLQ